MVGKRIDAYLAGRYPDYSRSVVQKVIDADAVLVNGAAVKASYKVRLDDLIRVWLPELADDAPVAEDIPLAHRLRGRGVRRRRQGPRHGHAPGQGELVRHPGQRPPAPLRHPLDRRRREPAGDRPPPRPRHLGPPDRRQGRPRPPPPRLAVRGPDDPQGIPRPGLGRPRPRQRLHRDAPSASTRPAARRWPSATPRTAARRP